MRISGPSCEQVLKRLSAVRRVWVLLLDEPAAIALVLFRIASVAAIVTATAYSPDTCSADIREQKRLETEELINELRRQREEERMKTFQDVFDPDQIAPGEEVAPEQNNISGFGGVFAPNNLNSD